MCGGLQFINSNQLIQMPLLILGQLMKRSTKQHSTALYTGTFAYLDFIETEAKRYRSSLFVNINRVPRIPSPVPTAKI